MKAKKAIGLALIEIFLLLTATTVLASKEVEVESITCPSTIVIGTKTDGELKGTVTLTFEEYLKGVVYKEMWLAGITSNEALKAQAVAARNYAVRNMGRHSSGGYDLCDQIHCQVWLPEPAEGCPSSVNTAITETSGIGATYNAQP